MTYSDVLPGLRCLDYGGLRDYGDSLLNYRANRQRESAFSASQVLISDW